jgi:hypothetical protein
MIETPANPTLLGIQASGSLETVAQDFLNPPQTNHVFRPEPSHHLALNSVCHFHISLMRMRVMV